MKLKQLVLVTWWDHVGGLHATITPERSYTVGWVQEIHPQYVRLAQTYDDEGELSFPFMVILRSDIISVKELKGIKN